MKFSVLVQWFSLVVILGFLSVACGGSSSETPMPLEPLPHSGPESKLPSDEDNDDPPEGRAVAPEARPPAETSPPSETTPAPVESAPAESAPTPRPTPLDDGAPRAD